MKGDLFYNIPYILCNPLKKKNQNLPKVFIRPIMKSNSFEFDTALPVYLFLSFRLKSYIHLHQFCFFKIFPTKMRILTELAASEYDHSFSNFSHLYIDKYMRSFFGYMFHGQ